MRCLCSHPFKALYSFRATAILALVLLTGCSATQSNSLQNHRSFRFPDDAFAYPNQLVWEYQPDPTTGRMVTKTRHPPPDYSHHCVVVARAARQFFQHAIFLPDHPKLAPEEYRSRARQILSRSPRGFNASTKKVAIPGYRSLRHFSQEHEELLKELAGGAWQSYFQMGNWRMIFPFTRHSQAKTAERLVASLDQNRPPIVHLVRFPSLSINHTILLYSYENSADQIEFRAYDPNDPEKPAHLIYEKFGRRFFFPPNTYFHGDWVNAYEIYSTLCY